MSNSTSKEKAINILDDMLIILRSLPRHNSDYYATVAALDRILVYVQSASEREAGLRIVRFYEGTTGSFKEFYIGSGTARGQRFDELKDELYKQGTLLIGGEAVSHLDANRKIFTEPDNLGWKIFALIAGGAVSIILLWNLSYSETVLAIWILGIFSMGLIILRPYWMLARILLSLTTTIFSVLIGLIIIVIFFPWFTP